MKYGLIGEKLSHSFSKEIHAYLADYIYELCEIDRSSLPMFFKKREFSAINVTMPYKGEVIPFLDEISPSAKELDAVNVIVNKNGKLYGYNTDYDGLKNMILRAKIDVSGKKALILGTGGAARTAALVLKHLGAREIHLVSRSKIGGVISYDDMYSSHSDAEIIINATPVGMFPNSYASPIDVSKFHKLSALFDAVYNPIKTKLVLDAQEMGAYAEGGLYMLVSQAVRAVELFLDAEFEADKTEEIYKKILLTKQNIVLIGMPSSGKTTVGELLSEKLGRKLVDLDDEIEKRIGCTIAEFFKTHTEKDFRDIETEITKEISMRNGIIIATGGGCILRHENVKALRSNGRLYFIDRALENLIPTDSRPLATKREDIERLFEARYGIYLSVCDVKIDGNIEPCDEAELITKEFYTLI